MIELRAIGLVYDAPSGDLPVRVLDDFSLAVSKGMVALSGRSGSGKTTILNVAAGLLTPTEGEVIWDGVSIAGLPDKTLSAARRSSIGFVFQSAGLIPSLTALENVAAAGYGVRGLKHGEDRARKLLRDLGIEQRAKHMPAELSAGERQRVGFARALFLDPVHLLVDEPTANLDRAAAGAVVEILRELVAAGRTLLVASHDPELVGVADRVVQLT